MIAIKKKKRFCMMEDLVRNVLSSGKTMLVLVVGRLCKRYVGVLWTGEAVVMKEVVVDGEWSWMEEGKAKTRRLGQKKEGEEAGRGLNLNESLR